MPRPDLEEGAPASFASVGNFVQDASCHLGEQGQVVAEVLGLIFGALRESLDKLQQGGRANDDLSLTLDAVGIEVIFSARNSPTAPIVLGGHDHRVGARKRVMLALVGALPPFWARSTRQADGPSRAIL